MKTDTVKNIYILVPLKLIFVVLISGFDLNPYFAELRSYPLVVVDPYRGPNGPFSTENKRIIKWPDTNID